MTYSRMSIKFTWTWRRYGVGTDEDSRYHYDCFESRLFLFFSDSTVSQLMHAANIRLDPAFWLDHHTRSPQ